MSTLNGSISIHLVLNEISSVLLSVRPSLRTSPIGLPIHKAAFVDSAVLECLGSTSVSSSILESALVLISIREVNHALAISFLEGNVSLVEFSIGPLDFTLAFLLSLDKVGSHDSLVREENFAVAVPQVILVVPFVLGSVLPGHLT